VQQLQQELQGSEDVEALRVRAAAAEEERDEAADEAASARREVQALQAELEAELEKAPSTQQVLQSDGKVATRELEGFRVVGRSRGRYATPADFPLHDCSPY
jgi:hypothetical protein